MRSPQSLTQRIVPALAVTVVATLIFGAVVVTADVASGEAQNLPATFGVAAPMQGDAWRYNLTLGGDWTFGEKDNITLGQAVPFGTLSWAGTAAVRGSDGLLHDANRFEADLLTYRPRILEAATEMTFACVSSENGTCLESGEKPYWGTATASGWVLAGTQQFLTQGDATAFNLTQRNSAFGIDQFGSYDKYYWEYLDTAFPAGKSPCLAFNPLQGVNVTLNQELPLLAPCDLGDALLSIPDGLLFHAAAVENRSGVQALRFDAKLNGTYQVWFTPGVPYPVRISVELPSQRPLDLQDGDEDLPGPRSLVLEMTGFLAGSQPLNGVDDPASRDPFPPLVEAAPMYNGAIRLGPSEAGVQHPFPLSVAFQAAKDSRDGGNLRDFLARFPLSYLAAAEYTEGTGAMEGIMSPTSTYDRVWRFGLTDGLEDYGFSVAQRSFDNWVPTDARNDTVPDPVLLLGYDEPDGNWKTAPSASHLPATMPTATSLADRWAAFDGSGLPANAWGFSIACDNSTGSCRLHTTYWAGHERHLVGGTSPGGGFFPTGLAIPGNPYGIEERLDITRRVTFTPDGTAVSVHVTDERHYHASTDNTIGPLPPVPVLGPNRDPGYTVQSEAISGIPPSYVSWLPEPKQAAQITFLGLAVGFLYWVWPKLGVVGLFSRLHKSELLEHPARSRLVQIVESQPGIHFHDLAAKAELANGTAVHHLRKLSVSGHINVRRSGRYTCYFPGGRVDPAQAAAAPLLKSDGAKQVLEAVRSKPGMSNLELAQAIGLQPSTVNYHVQRLANAGLVAALRDGRNVRLHPGARAGSLDMPDASGAAA